MQNLLVGNGINIQFDNKNYTNSNIILRLLSNLDKSDFPRDLIIDEPLLLKWHLGKLFLFAREMIDGSIDNFTTCTAERESLKEFKERYKKYKCSLKITDIGYEDYYLIHDLYCHKFEIKNPEQFYIRESMRMSYLFSIYNRGKLNLLYKKYSKKFLDFLNKFDNIFSTNYDNNIELATGKVVYHLHGQFDKLSEVYNPSSFRNQLQDKPLEGIKYDEKYSYLHSTALSTYCGDYKQFQIKQHYSDNKAVEKMAQKYLTDKKIHEEIEKWSKSDNQLIVNMADGIRIKAKNPEVRFQEDYYINEFKSIKGDIYILGLSPYNDSHIFEIINKSDINKCYYYYFNILECSKIEELLSNLKSKGKLIFKDVKKFWSDL